MIAFWVCAAALAAIALALVLRPLWSRRAGAASRVELNVSVRRDQLRELDADLRAGTLAQGDYDRARRELERRLLEDVDGGPPEAPAPRTPGLGAVASVAAGIPILAVAVYLAIGNLRGLDPGQHQVQAQAIGKQEIEAMVQRLADRLAQSPEDVEGWKMLGRSYSVMGRFADAATAFSQAAARMPRDPQILADLADSLAMARGQDMRGEPEEFALRALKLDPGNLKALALAGTAAFDRKDYRSAARHWERMLPLVEPGSEDARTIQANVDEARALSKKGPEKGDPGKKAVSALQGTVSLSPRLAGKAGPGDVVFIFARAADGPPMPLAVLRKTVRELPSKFLLDDSMAMTPAMKLSGVERVIVGARISKSGNAAPQPGDPQGLSPPVSSNARGVNLVIDTEVPKK